LLLLAEQDLAACRDLLRNGCDHIGLTQFNSHARLAAMQYLVAPQFAWRGKSLAAERYRKSLKSLRRHTHGPRSRCACALLVYELTPSQSETATCGPQHVAIKLCWKSVFMQLWAKGSAVYIAWAIRPRFMEHSCLQRHKRVGRLSFLNSVDL
jgi:hypothetical protein